MVFHSERTWCVHPLANAVSQVTGHATFRAVVLFALACNIAGCEAVVNRVRIEPGTTPLTPVFVVTDSTGRQPSGTIYGLSVVQCGADTAIWQIAADGSQTAPSRIEYGHAPPGYVVRAGPGRLRAGCYDVFITDGRRARFRVDATGRVVTDARRDSTTR